MQTPAGYEVINGQFHARDWLAVLFNPSFPYRFAHTLLASTLTASFLIAGLSAWQVLKGKATAGTGVALRCAVLVAAVAIPLQIFMGDLHGLNTLKHQPAKIAALEAIWTTEKSAPLTLLGWPSEAEGRTLGAVQVPGLASLILAHDMQAEIKGLNEFEGAHPPVAPLFWGFRVMVGMGLLMLAVAWASAWLLWRQREPAEWPRPWLWLLSGMAFSGWLATLAGWYVTEIGRQPFIVYGLVRTADVAASHAPSMVALTLTAYVTVYLLLLLAYVGVLKHMAENPQPAVAPDLGASPRPMASAST
jgi:cytochrome d ubiquinol oxidase subunit I